MRLRIANGLGVCDIDLDRQPIPVPDAPSGLTADLENTVDVRLNWTDNSSDEDGFHVYRGVNGGPMLLLATVAANVTTYLDTNAPAGSTLAYRVNAYNSFGQSPGSNVASVDTPGQETFLRATQVIGEFRITWDNDDRTVWP
jgi:hypothetical protein